MRNKLFLAGVLLTLIGCDQVDQASKGNGNQAPVAAVIPGAEGQYLRFVNLVDGETRLEVHQVKASTDKVISGYPGFVVEPGMFPDMATLSVRIKDCGVITFERKESSKGTFTARRTGNDGATVNCPIQELSGPWTPLKQAS